MSRSNLERFSPVLRPEKGDRHTARGDFLGVGASHRAASQSPFSSVWAMRTRTAPRGRFGLAVLALAVGFSLPARGQAPGGGDRPSDVPTPIASTRTSGTIAARAPVAPNLVRASARLVGTASPGLRMTLDGTSSTGGRVWYRWLQTDGPKVAIDDPAAVEAHFIVPAEASMLGFVLVIGNASGVDARAVSAEVSDPEREAVELALKADAGDPQSTRVGRKVVLNGVRSEPRGKIRYRWVQAGGPKVALKSGDGPTATFLPTTPGTYQFALIVATANGVMSEPSRVEVTVGGTARAGDSPTMAIDELARVSLSSIEGGPKYADELSKAFDAVADGINSVRTFAEALAETTRRLDAVVPRDKERRAVWIEQLFSPLMAKLVAGMKDDGLDLAQPGAQFKALTREQKVRLADQFRYAAAGLRTSKTIR